MLAQATAMVKPASTLDPSSPTSTLSHSIESGFHSRTVPSIEAVTSDCCGSRERDMPLTASAWMPSTLRINMPEGLSHRKTLPSASPEKIRSWAVPLVEPCQHARQKMIEGCPSRTEMHTPLWGSHTRMDPSSLPEMTCPSLCEQHMEDTPPECPVIATTALAPLGALRSHSSSLLSAPPEQQKKPWRVQTDQTGPWWPCITRLAGLSGALSTFHILTRPSTPPDTRYSFSAATHSTGPECASPPWPKEREGRGAGFPAAFSRV
mmetsp:Transcript_28205/g.71415  ORF Transcript_28205/g.71415 Transcript_28205/m.71415 type:complete len:264 (+) Transcript_28205:122-913(+)